ncbi:DeoR family transcriptional regulator [Candidatus Microgenomates bacterium]|nr:DeoR family transcriptional regulator [Candidatus Microgenomates bacterium]
MIDLTLRQSQLLKAIIEEYIESAEAVGSETIEKKYPKLGISPATIRNEMVKLTEAGFLKKLHSSAGRVPTPVGLKFYIRELMKTKEVSVREEVAVKEKVWNYRHSLNKLLREATHLLAEKTKTLALATNSEGDLFASGMANVLAMPEFYDINLTKNLLFMLDRVDFWENLFAQAIESEEPIHILLGEELGEFLGSCGFVYSHYQAGSKYSGAIGVVGPVRLDYPYIIPTVRYFGDLITEVTKNW